jgi:hypothetical protein
MICMWVAFRTGSVIGDRVPAHGVGAITTAPVLLHRMRMAIRHLPCLSTHGVIHVPTSDGKPGLLLTLPRRASGPDHGASASTQHRLRPGDPSTTRRARRVMIVSAMAKHVINQVKFQALHVTPVET